MSPRKPIYLHLDDGYNVEDISGLSKAISPGLEIVLTSSSFSSVQNASDFIGQLNETGLSRNEYVLRVIPDPFSDYNDHNSVSIKKRK